MTLLPGARLGPYEIVNSLGAGGMGEVYRALDPRLGREVAIKVLPADCSADPDRLRRFEQEARAAAALNHPSILAVHDLGTHNGAPYIVSELLEGSTLRAALAKGALPVRKAIDYAIQIANGLAAAHDRSIVHRDLKPENLFVTHDGRVKILDFGLAKLTEKDPVGVGVTMAATRAAGTTPGIVLGTIGYMPPEQVRGQDVDHRSDIFSFGAILYEMLSGERAFAGTTPADTMSAILTSEPRDFATVTGGAVSPALERIARHCLEKDPSRRFQSTRDLAFDLETASGTSGVSATPARATPSSRRRWLLPVAAGLLGLASGALAVSLINPSAGGTRAGTPVVEHMTRITHETGFSEWPTWAPDGSQFAFSSNRGGNFDIYVGRVESGVEVVNVTNHPADDVQPATSPDGNAIAFVSTRSSRTGLVKIAIVLGFDTRTFGGDVWVTPALGGEARRLAEDGNFPAWHPNGRSVLYVTGQENHRAISSVSIDGGAPIPILSSAASNWEIIRLNYSPDARWITFETTDRRLFIMPAAGGQPTELMQASSHVWDRTGRRIYYVNQEAGGGTRVEAAEVDQAAEAPTAVRTSIVGVSAGNLRDLAIAMDGRRLLASVVEASLNLTRIGLAPGGGDVAGPEQALSTGQARDRYPTISPDGQQIAVGSNRIGDEGLWLVDVSSARWRRVRMPSDADDFKQACWTPDGQHLVVKRFFRNGTTALWHVALDGSAMEELRSPVASLTASFSCAFSPDGRRLVHVHLVDGFSQLFIVDIASRQERQLTSSRSDKLAAAWSPDGRWVAFSANMDGPVQVWRIPTDGGEEQRLTTGSERMIHLFYSPDGRWLYVQPSHRNVYRMPSDGGALQPVTRFPESGLFLEEPTISPDGSYLVYNRSHGGSSLWMLTLGGSAER